MSKIDHSLFSVHEHALEKKFEVCPKCASQTQVKHSKSGSFIGCVSYPECDFTRPLVERNESLIKVLAGSQCPDCGRELAVKNGRFGMFIGCTNFPNCHYIVNDASPEKTLPQCPECQTGSLTKRSNKTGRTFYSCDTYPKCKYILNHLPVAHTCPECGWQVMVEKNTASGKVLQCAQKQCGHKLLE